MENLVRSFLIEIVRNCSEVLIKFTEMHLQWNPLFLTETLILFPQLKVIVVKNLEMLRLTL